MDGQERGFRRRKPIAERSAGDAIASTAPSEQGAAAAPPPPPPVEHRTPTDLDGLREVADMDRAEIAALMEAFAPSKKSAVRQGQRVRGTITRLGASIAFVSLGGKADANIDRVELDADVVVGAVIDAYVVSTKDGEIRLARSIGGDNTSAMLDDAVENRIPVQGKIVSRNEHGFEVALSGGVRAFCPLSQIDHVVEPDLDTYIGRSLAFRVLNVRGREAVVSHRAIAEVEAKEASDRTLSEMKEGEIHEGTVTGIREFGAFVRLSNGVEGLVRLPNLANKRVSDASTVVQQGQAVRVRVLGVDTARRRLDLGIRQVEGGDAPAAARGEPMTTGGTFGTLAGLLADVRVAPKKKR